MNDSANAPATDVVRVNHVRMVLVTALILVFVVFTIVAWRASQQFWPAELQEWVVDKPNGQQTVVAGQIWKVDEVSDGRARVSGEYIPVPDDFESGEYLLLKTANREVDGRGFTWVDEKTIIKRSRPMNLLILERSEPGKFIGRLVGIRQSGQLIETSDLEQQFEQRLDRATSLHERITTLQQGEIADVNYRLEQLRLKERELGTADRNDPEFMQALNNQLNELLLEQINLQAELISLSAEISRDVLIMKTANGENHEIPVRAVLEAYKPNKMNTREKIRNYFASIWTVLSGDRNGVDTGTEIQPTAEPD